MILAKGSRVRFIFTGEEGTVTELLDDGMLNVRLDDGEVIPAFAEDVVRIEDNRPLRKPPVKAKSVQGKKDKSPPPPKRIDPTRQYAILKSKGIQLAFATQKRPDGSTAHFDVYLINDTRYDVIYNFSLETEGHTPPQRHGKLERLSAQQIDQLPFDQLNESPQISIDCWQLTTEGTGPKLSRSIRLKPQQFFKKNTTAPILDIPVYLYIVFDKLEPDTKPPPTEDLQAYTKRKTPPPTSQSNKGYSRLQKYDTRAFVDFNNELDLHVENLTDSTSGMSNADILHLQMRHFTDYMHRAIRLGVPKVFIIHGVGKGRLRSEISRWLNDNPYVIAHKNEYHHRFGYGATEVDL